MQIHEYNPANLTKRVKPIAVSENGNSETIVKRYYEENGYTVKQGNSLKALRYRNYLLTEFEVQYDQINHPGIPDFFVAREDEETMKEGFFVEAKHEKGGLNMRQLEWLYRYPDIPVRIAVVVSSKRAERPYMDAHEYRAKSKTESAMVETTEGDTR